MKPLTLLGTLLSVTLLFTACNPKGRKKKENPVAAGNEKPKTNETGKPGEKPTIDPNNPDGPSKPGDTVDTSPKPKDNIPPPPKEGPEEYAKKITGKPGFVTDPHDKENRPLDVRGMPPGTKIQSPFSGSVLLVPPQ